MENYCFNNDFNKTSHSPFFFFLHICVSVFHFPFLNLFFWDIELKNYFKRIFFDCPENFRSLENIFDKKTENNFFFDNR